MNSDARSVDAQAGAEWVGRHFSTATGLVALIAADGRVLGSSWPAAEGQALAGFFLPEAQPQIEAALAQLDGRGPMVQLDVPLRRRDGSPGMHLLVLSPVPDDSGRVTAQSVDVTERRREEARLRRTEAMMVDTQGVAHLGVWDWDITQPHAEWSPELYRIYGLDPRNYVPTYDEYLKRVHPDDRQRVIDATNAAFNDHRPYSHDERIYRSDGALRWLHTWAYPVLDEAGKLLRLTGVCQDITDRALAEQAVVEHAAQLGRANAELEQFARLAAHDLQEPLRTVASFVQILEQRFGAALDADSAQAMDFIVQAVRRMKAQIGDLMKYVQATAGQAPKAEVDLELALTRVEADLAAAIREAGATIRHSPLPRVRAEPGQVDSLLRNLVDNAIKFRGAQPPRIEVGAEVRDGQVEVVVRDNGVGIDAHYQERIFLVFQRLDPARPGTGIGLAVCKKIVDGNGGRIWVESREGEGAAFHFTLPAVTGHEH